MWSTSLARSRWKYHLQVRIASPYVGQRHGQRKPVVHQTWILCCRRMHVKEVARQGYRALQEMNGGFVMSKTYSTFNAFAEFVQAIANFYSTFRAYMPDATEPCLHPSLLKPQLLTRGRFRASLSKLDMLLTNPIPTRLNPSLPMCPCPRMRETLRAWFGRESRRLIHTDVF